MEVGKDAKLARGPNQDFRDCGTCDEIAVSRQGLEGVEGCYEMLDFYAERCCSGRPGGNVGRNEKTI